MTLRERYLNYVEKSLPLDTSDMSRDQAMLAVSALDLVFGIADEHARRGGFFLSTIREKRRKFLNSEELASVLKDGKRWPELESTLASINQDNYKELIVLTNLVTFLHAYVFYCNVANWCLLSWYFTFAIHHIWPCLVNLRRLRVWRNVWNSVPAGPQYVLSVSVPTSEEQNNVAPKMANFLLWILLPRANRRDAIAEIDGQFEEVRELHGIAKARLFYWSEVLDTAKERWAVRVLVAVAIQKLAKWLLP